MKRKNFIRHRPGGRMILPFCVAALVLAGCGSENDVNGNGTTAGRTPLQVTSGIQTRAHDDVWEAGDAIGIFSMHGSGESLSVEDSNRKYTTTSDATKGTFSPADAAQTIYFPTNGDTRDFIAYYPWQKTLGTDGRTYTVDVTDQKVQNLIDLLGAGKVTGKDKDHPQVALTFTHKLVKIALDIQAGNGLDQQGTRGYGNNPDRTADKCPIRRCGGRRGGDPGGRGRNRNRTADGCRRDSGGSYRIACRRYGRDVPCFRHTGCGNLQLESQGCTQIAILRGWKEIYIYHYG